MSRGTREGLHDPRFKWPDSVPAQRERADIQRDLLPDERVAVTQLAPYLQTGGDRGAVSKVGLAVGSLARVELEDGGSAGDRAVGEHFHARGRVRGQWWR